METALDSNSIASHLGYLGNFARRRLGNPDDAADAVQDALVAALTARASFRGRSRVRTWLTGILNHKITDAMRRSGAASMRFVSDPDAIDALALPECEQPDALLERSRLVALVEATLAELPPRAARAFRMSVFGDESEEDIARALQVPRRHSSVICSRARAKVGAAIRAAEKAPRRMGNFAR